MPVQKKRELLYVINSLENGGAEMLAIRLAEQLGNGIHATVCSLSDAGPLRQIMEEKGVSYVTLGKKEGKDFPLVGRLRRLLKERQIDIVHTHNQGTLLYIWLATRMMANRPVLVHTEHINMYKEFSYSLRHRLYNELLYRSLDGFISIAEHLSTDFRRKFEGHRMKVETIHNSINPAEYDFRPQSDLRAELGLPAETPLLGCIAALRPQKDHATLFAAMEQVHKRYPQAHLVVAGDGELQQQLEQTRQERGLTECITMAGYRGDVANLLAQLDLFVLPSLYEGLPLSVLEAMAAGRAIVATDADGINELIRHNETGLLVPLRDADALAEAICSLLENRDEITRLGEAARKFVEQEHNFDTMIHKYETYYHSFFQ